VSVCVCGVPTHPLTTPPQLQFDVTNTLEDQLLTNVRVEMEEPDGFKVVGSIPIESLPYNKPGTTYTIVELVEQDTGRDSTLCLLLVCYDGSASLYAAMHCLQSSLPLLGGGGRFHCYQTQEAHLVAHNSHCVSLQNCCCLSCTVCGVSLVYIRTYVGVNHT